MELPLSVRLVWIPGIHLYLHPSPSSLRLHPSPSSLCLHPSLLSLCLHLNPSSIFDSESPPLLPCDFWASATFGGFCLGRSILSPPPVTRAVPQAALCLSACICVRAAGVSSAPAAPSLCPQTTQNLVLCFTMILFPRSPPSPSCCHFEMKSSAHIFNKNKLTRI